MAGDNSTKNKRVCGGTHVSFAFRRRSPDEATVETIPPTLLSPHCHPVATTKQITYWAGGFPTTLLDDFQAAAKKHGKGQKPSRLYIGYHGHRCDAFCFVALTTSPHGFFWWRFLPLECINFLGDGTRQWFVNTLGLFHVVTACRVCLRAVRT